jgi:RHS repeat-associated protein
MWLRFDNAGNVVERYAYDPFGQVTVLDAGWNVLATSAFGWVHLHQGGRFDATSGLYHFRHRDYSPTLGRWTSLDLIRYLAGDVSLYRAVGNMPTGRTDPSGLDWVWPWDPRADWSDWRIGEAFSDITGISGTMSVGVTGELYLGIIHIQVAVEIAFGVSAKEGFSGGLVGTGGAQIALGLGAGAAVYGTVANADSVGDLSGSATYVGVSTPSGG